mmetsp:Transcript_5187/g.10115  ORF Transcript_5187/g.10115 Transcript_5187/m.10115 type:complete len:209 (+) Transcript_5187:1147-1773(+)
MRLSGVLGAVVKGDTTPSTRLRSPCLECSRIPFCVYELHFLSVPCCISCVNARLLLSIMSESFPRVSRARSALTERLFMLFLRDIILDSLRRTPRVPPQHRSMKVSQVLLNSSVWALYSTCSPEPLIPKHKWSSPVLLGTNVIPLREWECTGLTTAPSGWYSRSSYLPLIITSSRRLSLNSPFGFPTSPPTPVPKIFFRRLRALSNPE